MSFFNRWRKPTPLPIDILDTRERVRLITERVGHHPVRLTDLFAMIGEDDLIVQRRKGGRPVAVEKDARRVLPGDIPTTGEFSQWVGD